VELAVGHWIPETATLSLATASASLTMPAAISWPLGWTHSAGCLEQALGLLNPALVSSTVLVLAELLVKLC
jgi:hypothetical protein